MKKLSVQKNTVLFFFMIIIALTLCTVRFWPKKMRNPIENTYSISGWPYSEIPEPGIIAGRFTQEGTIRVKIPNINEDTVLCFYLNEQSASVYMGGKMIFTKQSPDTDVWCYVPLSQEASGHMLFLFFSSSSAGTPGILRSVYLGTIDECNQLIRRDMLPGLALCFAVFCFGIIFVVLGSYSREVVEASAAIRHIGVMFILITIWGLSNLPVLKQIFINTSALHYMGRVCIMLVPTQFAQVVRLSVADNKDLCVEVDYFSVIFYLLFGFALLADALGICSLAITNQWSRLLGFSFFIYLLIFGILEPAMILHRGGKQSLHSTMGQLSVMVGLFYVGFEAWFTLGSFLTVRASVTRTLFILCSVLCLTVFIMVLYDSRTLIQLQDSLAQSRMKLMLSQIQPHFMYNTLNSIRTMLRKDTDTADLLVLQFSKYLRSNIRSISCNDLVPFSQEISLIESYVAIEEVCHPQIKVKYEIDVHNFSIPPLSVQPLIENAIRHGVLQKPGGGTVILRTKNTDSGILIEVEDNGVGFSEEAILGKRESYGLNNIRMRLEYLCRAKIDVFSAEGEGSCVRIHIPKLVNGRKS